MKDSVQQHASRPASNSVLITVTIHAQPNAVLDVHHRVQTVAKVIAPKIVRTDVKVRPMQLHVWVVEQDVQQDASIVANRLASIEDVQLSAA